MTDAEQDSDLARLYDLYSDRRYLLGSRLVEFDVGLPPDMRLIEGSGSSAVELLLIAKEQIRRDKQVDGGYVPLACRAAVGMASELTTVPDNLAFVYIPSRRVNARSVRSEAGRPVVVLDSSLFAVLPNLVSNYIAMGGVTT